MLECNCCSTQNTLPPPSNGGQVTLTSTPAEATHYDVWASLPVDNYASLTVSWRVTLDDVLLLYWGPYSIYPVWYGSTVQVFDLYNGFTVSSNPSTISHGSSTSFSIGNGNTGHNDQECSTTLWHPNLPMALTIAQGADLGTLVGATTGTVAELANTQFVANGRQPCSSSGDTVVITATSSGITKTTTFKVIPSGTLDHFAVTISPDTISTCKPGTITAIAKDASNNEAFLDCSTYLTLTSNGRFIQGTDTLASPLNNVPYSEARNGNIKVIPSASSPPALAVHTQPNESPQPVFADKRHEKVVSGASPSPRTVSDAQALWVTVTGAGKTGTGSGYALSLPSLDGLPPPSPQTITAEPAMPSGVVLQAKLNNYDYRCSTLPLQWDITVIWNSGSHHTEHKYSGNGSLNSSDWTNIPVTWDGVIRGGQTVNVHMQANYGPFSFDKKLDNAFSIVGINPSKAAAKAYLGDLKYQIIAYNENKFKQFDGDGLPSLGTNPADVGMMQINKDRYESDFNKTWDDDFYWNWHKNVDAAKDIFDVFKYPPASIQDALYNAPYVDETGKTRQHHARNFTDGEKVTNAIQFYHGGYLWKWKQENQGDDPDSPDGDWDIDYDNRDVAYGIKRT